jgi:hypothetical protein
MSVPVVVSGAQVPLPRRAAFAAVGRCVVASAALLAGRRLHLPRRHVGRVLRFADGTAGRVYRETTLDRPPAAQPCALVVRFRLRYVRGAGHRLFEWESVLNTPMFVGFRGFVSKLWVAHDERGTYRGIYEWDGERAAHDYARALWQVLALVSVPGSIDYRVLPGVHRDDLLMAAALAGGPPPWWQPVEAA